MSTKSADIGSAIENVLIGGDLSKLSPEERVNYYKRVCESLNLNPLTKPFAYISLNSKLVLYALRDCTDQLRKNNGVSIDSLETKIEDDLCVVIAKGHDRSGRTDAATGVVPIGTLKGEQRANALMKAETKAKRRMTLSICGLGMTDESEVDSIPGAKVVEEPHATTSTSHSSSASPATPQEKKDASRQGKAGEEDQRPASEQSSESRTEAEKWLSRFKSQLDPMKSRDEVNAHWEAFEREVNGNQKISSNDKAWMKSDAWAYRRAHITKMTAAQ